MDAASPVQRKVCVESVDSEDVTDEVTANSFDEWRELVAAVAGGSCVAHAPGGEAAARDHGQGMRWAAARYEAFLLVGHDSSDLGHQQSLLLCVYHAK